jgi:hypothetical protein
VCSSDLRQKELQTAKVNLALQGFDLINQLVNDFDNNSPFGWLLEPYDEHSVIFTKEL